MAIPTHPFFRVFILFLTTTQEDHFLLTTLFLTSGEFFICLNFLAPIVLPLQGLPAY